jgi:hypothetical protein
MSLEHVSEGHPKKCDGKPHVVRKAVYLKIIYPDDGNSEKMTYDFCGFDARCSDCPGLVPCQCVSLPIGLSTKEISVEMLNCHRHHNVRDWTDYCAKKQTGHNETKATQRYCKSKNCVQFVVANRTLCMGCKFCDNDECINGVKAGVQLCDDCDDW